MLFKVLSNSDENKTLEYDNSPVLSSNRQAFFSSSPKAKVNALGNYTPIKHFEDGDAPITFKEGYVNGKPTSNLLTHHIIATRYEAHYKKFPLVDMKNTVLEEGHLLTENLPYHGLTLIKKANNTWIIYDQLSATEFLPDASQTYIFVTMPDKTIRVASEHKGGHALLSNSARYIRYAGEVRFDANQRIAYWNNQSGAYYPPPFLARQAAFDDGIARFESRYDRNSANTSNQPVMTCSP